MQHWLKVMHRFRGGEHATVGDPHRLGRDGEPDQFEAGRLAISSASGLRPSRPT